MIKQRRASDCGIAALAELAETSYEDSYVAFASLDASRGAYGFYNRDVIRAAKKVGLTLTPARHFDLDVDEGILVVRWNRTTAEHRKNDGHFVVIKSGLIFCPTDGCSTAWAEYLERWDGRPATLLKVG